jgi:hypothetical protein
MMDGPGRRRKDYTAQATYTKQGKTQQDTYKFAITHEEKNIYPKKLYRVKSIYVKTYLIQVVCVRGRWEMNDFCVFVFSRI